MSDLAKVDYVERVNRAIDHIQNNLERDLRLGEVAAVAHFSPFHFHRVFKTLVGETLHAFVKRLRLERALYLMSHTEPESLTRVALECGFSSSSDFSRSFRQQFGVAPSKFDLDSWRARKRAALQGSLPGDHGARLERLPPGSNPDGFEVELRVVEARRVVYSRVFDPFRPDVVPAAAAEMVEWAVERGVVGGRWLGYMWEDPELVDLEHCRYDVGLVVPPDFEPDGVIGVVDFPTTTLARVPCSGPIDVEQRALDWLFGTWLPGSGYIPDDQPVFEAWTGRPFEHGLEHFELAVELPVRRAGRWNQKR